MRHARSSGPQPHANPPRSPIHSSNQSSDERLIVSLPIVIPKYRPIVATSAMAAGAVGIPGAFSGGFDMAAVSGIWTGMTVAIAAKSGHKVDAAFAAKIVTSIATGAAAYLTGSKLLTFALHAVPVAGSLAAMGINGSLNYWFTYRVGRALSALFDRSDFTPQDLGEIVRAVTKILASFPGPTELRDALRLILWR